MLLSISLIVYPEDFGPAHWSLYIPSYTNPLLGKLAHINDELDVEIVRNYSIPAPDTTMKRQIIELGRVDTKDNNVADVLGGAVVKDKKSQDKLEGFALSIKLPHSETVCQAYVYDLVKLLHAHGIIVQDDFDQVMQRLNKAPRFLQ